MQVDAQAAELRDAGLAAGDARPADAAGDWSAVITNGANGCDLANWTVGAVARDVPIRVTQVGRGLTASFEGLAGWSLDWGPLGGHVFTGEVDGDRVVLRLDGTKRANERGCHHTYAGIIEGRRDNDFLRASLRYERVLDGTDRCAALACTTEQALNATRAPDAR